MKPLEIEIKEEDMKHYEQMGSATILENIAHYEDMTYIKEGDTYRIKNIYEVMRKYRMMNSSYNV